MTKPSFGAVPLFVLVLAGCTTSGSTTGTVAAFDAHFGTFLCDLYASCAFAVRADDPSAMILSLSRDQCIRFTDAIEFEHHGPSIPDYVADGTIVYSPAEAERCLASIQSLCAAPSGGLLASAPCVKVFTGQQGAGDPCFIDEQCTRGLRCDAPHEDANGRGEPNVACTPGACVARTAPGEVCEDDEECLAPESGWGRCDYVDSSYRCVQVRLETERGLGEICGDYENASGRVEALCAAGLHCRRPEEGDAVCAVPLEAGASCVPGVDACAVGLACVDSASGGTCAKLVVSSEVGAACDAMRLCNVFVGLVCTGGSCVSSIGDGSVGAICRTGQVGAVDCDEGNYCDEDALTCAAKKAVGGACTDDVQCVMGECEEDAGICVTRTYCH